MGFEKKIELKLLAIEVTRNCNLVCKDYCMRGKGQNIYQTKENVDSLLDMVNISSIEVESLLFSGGEPMLMRI